MSVLSARVAVALSATWIAGCAEPSQGAARQPGVTGAQTTGGPGESESTDATTSDPGSDSTGSGAPQPSTTGAATSTTEAGSASSDSEGPVDLGCDTPVFESPGMVKSIEHGDSHWSVKPLEPGRSFHCMRVEFDIQTADSQQEILDMYEGCPIFLGIAAVVGDGPEGGPVGSMLFKPWRVGCTPGPDRVELDTFVEGTVEQGPWPLGGLYHVVLEVNVDSEFSTVALYQDGAQVGPAVTSSLAGVTLEMNRDPIVGLGMEQPATGAYFPNYGATYSNLVITADVDD